MESVKAQSRLRYNDSNNRLLGLRQLMYEEANCIHNCEALYTSPNETQAQKMLLSIFEDC